ncbi:hypothetical protein BC937DRAFT_89889 [Endogone sp. FLAS-F59071]|nr:hypothetical protein BC937DRAFT_89889 [Endogone sp. FLAS-F59071]|eukprot:RUS22257.1 hypothetical protein BC937DRAFT_89889 [Endogone sp. FLAS-F59071]
MSNPATLSPTTCFQDSIRFMSASEENKRQYPLRHWPRFGGALGAAPCRKRSSKLGVVQPLVLVYDAACRNTGALLRRMFDGDCPLNVRHVDLPRVSGRRDALRDETMLPRIVFETFDNTSYSI